ncbi:MAG: hypothetical protein SWY16_09410 [Cyanobacteriota bacterium]|nr:hypothetical protein [Cyanobacteriota bacterium]
MQRSGNHAIISWLIGQFDKPVFFLNCIKLKNKDSLQDFNPIELPSNSYCHIERVNRKRVINCSDIEMINKNHDYLLCSIENKNVVPGFKNLEEYIQNKLGESETKFNIIILRDPINALASYIRWKMLSDIEPIQVEKMAKNYTKKWLNHASVASQKELLNSHNIIPIFYNKWLLSED